jgi:hypothetical protein
MSAGPLRASLAAGVLAGVAGLLVFLAIHHLWIAPIWFILGPGLVIAAVGGLAVGWGYEEIRAALPARPQLAFLGLIGVILAPALFLSMLRPALFDVRTGDLASGNSVGEVVVRFVVELPVPATVVGGLAGWWLARTRRAALAMALAGFVFALGPGHNIPLLAGTPGVGKGAALLVAVATVSTLVLVETQARLAVRRRPRRRSDPRGRGRRRARRRAPAEASPLRRG